MLVLTSWINRARQRSREDITSCNHYCCGCWWLCRRGCKIRELLLPEWVALHLEDHWKRKEEGQWAAGPRTSALRLGSPSSGSRWAPRRGISSSPHERELNVQQWTSPGWVPGAKSWLRLSTGWKSRSWQRGTKWEEVLSVDRWIVLTGDPFVVG